MVQRKAEYQKEFEGEMRKVGAQLASSMNRYPSRGSDVTTLDRSAAASSLCL